MYENDSCPFCKRLQEARELHEYFAKRDTRSGTTKIQFRAALIVDTYYNNERCGRTTDSSFELQHCPVCGKKTEGNEIIYGQRKI